MPRNAVAERLEHNQRRDHQQDQPPKLAQRVDRGCIHFLAGMPVVRQHVAARVANQPEQKPGETDNHAHVPGCRDEVEQRIPRRLLHHLQRIGNANHPDHDGQRMPRRIDQRIVPHVDRPAGDAHCIT